MTRFRLELNIPGFREARNEPAVMAELMSMGERIAARASATAGGTFTVEPHPGGTRARVYVTTADIEAMLAEAHHRALSLALDAGRG